MRYRLLEFWDEDAREWHPAGIVADVAGEVVRWYGGRLHSGPNQRLEEMGTDVFPGSWGADDLRMTQVFSLPQTPTEEQLIDFLLALLQRKDPLTAGLSS